MIVASHNIMHGLRLDRLVEGYCDLRDRVGLDVLCIQENVPLLGASYASRIADKLGSDFAAIWDPGRPRVGMIYDASQVQLVRDELIELPRDDSVSWIDRAYLLGGVVERRFAQVVTFVGDDDELSLVNFHLQTAGAGRSGTEIRRRQIAQIADALKARQLDSRIVVCGDTNAFSWPWKRQSETLQYILQPLEKLGARDPGVRPTHYFGRQNEPNLTHKLAVLLGRIGLDLPQRYDVICTNLPVLRRGHDTTPDSDHDLVWAAL